MINTTLKIAVICTYVTGGQTLESDLFNKQHSARIDAKIAEAVAAGLTGAATHVVTTVIEGEVGDFLPGLATTIKFA